MHINVRETHKISDGGVTERLFIAWTKTPPWKSCSSLLGGNSCMVLEDVLWPGHTCSSLFGGNSCTVLIAVIWPGHTCSSLFGGNSCTVLIAVI